MTTRFKKRFLYLGLCFLFFLTPISSSADPKGSTPDPDTPDIIRVGCVDIDNFLDLTPDGYVQGYAADYLEKIAEYTGWSYEYVHGSWADCLSQLENDSIDLLMPAEYSPERAEKFLFSKEMCCMDYAALVGRKDDDSHYYEDYTAFQNMKVGMIEGNYLNQLFEEYARKNGFSVNAIYYPNSSSENDALADGEVDAIISGNMNFFPNQKLLAKISFMPAYFISSKKNPALMGELNQAQQNITLENPYYVAGLHEKYYGKIERQAVGFTREEVNYIQKSGVIRVLYEPDDYPLEYQDEDTGKARGIYLDILQMISRECGLNFEAVPNTTKTSSWKRVSRGDADLLLSAYGSIENKERYQLNFTESYYDASYSLAGRRGSSLNLDAPLKAAVVGHDEGEKSIVQRQYPQWQLIDCDSMEDCLKKVQAKTADISFVNSLILDIDSNVPGNADADTMTFSTDNIIIPVCLGVSQQADPMLKTILNKGIKKIETDEIQQCVFDNVFSTQRTLSLSYLVHKYPVQAMVILVLLVAAATFLFFCYYNYKIGKKQNLVLQLKNEELQNAIKKQQLFQHESEQDPLTGLKNRRAIQRLCHSILEGAAQTSCALLVIDIDEFKQVNDTFGHMEGDNTIKAVAGYLETVFPTPMIGRIGGDEFLVMLSPLQDREILDGYLEDFYRILHTSDTNGIRVTCSTGAVIAGGRNPLDYDELFSAADQTLYDAKNSGRDRYIVLSLETNSAL